MRIQNPQTNRYVIGITIFHWNCTTEIQEVFLGSIFEGVCVHGECEVRVGLVNSLQFFYGQVPELILKSRERQKKKKSEKSFLSKAISFITRDRETEPREIRNKRRGR